jgi:hypothetical protein
MTALFRRIKPAQKLRITLHTVAEFLKIPKSRILRVECWGYVLFVHRADRGGQFISYRQLQQWQNAIACQIQKCSTLKELQQLWLFIQADHKKYKKQYNDTVIPFLCKIWEKRWGILQNQQQLVDAATDF